MTNKFIKYYTQRSRTRTKLYLDTVGTVEYLSNESTAKKLTYFVILLTKNKILTELLSLDELENELLQIRNLKMVFISVPNTKRASIYKILNKISKKRGTCSPLIEIDKAIIYFPQLRYSDLGLLRFLCQQNKNIKEYKLLMASGN